MASHRSKFNYPSIRMVWTHSSVILCVPPLFCLYPSEYYTHFLYLQKLEVPRALLDVSFMTFCIWRVSHSGSGSSSLTVLTPWTQDCNLSTDPHRKAAASHWFLGLGFQKTRWPWDSVPTHGCRQAHQRGKLFLNLSSLWTRWLASHVCSDGERRKIHCLWLLGTPHTALGKVC